ncbi:chemotaxis protein CheW [Microvirga puerhi]|uniref:Chemotaxis protein CheW n=1 Tax=Microvirga puerhi TaxID=2876078 RepID=A0ABS7VQI5_9HYPH|nr:chemotaxis protein CheW [Microvirga puerhi]MBZ6077780.1 chemotaxis protein CheW [Microvirga puerhi]
MAKTLRRKLRQISRAGSLSAEERTQRILDERTQRLASRHAMQSPLAGETTSVLICDTGRESYGIPVHAIAEVLSFRECLPLPEGPPALIGLLGWNGQLISVIDLASALGTAPATEKSDGHLVLLRRSAPKIALRVDRAKGVETVTPIAPEETNSFRKEAILGYAEISSDVADQEKILSLLDLNRLLHPFLPSLPASGA